MFLNAFQIHKAKSRNSLSCKRNITLINIYTKTTQQKTQRKKKTFPQHRLCSRQERETAPTQNIMFVPLFHRACNPSGNKQKISVRRDEPAGREPRLLRPDMLMLPGVPVTESCKRSSKTRWLVSHGSAEGVRDEYEHSGAAHTLTLGLSALSLLL